MQYFLHEKQNPWQIKKKMTLKNIENKTWKKDKFLHQSVKCLFNIIYLNMKLVWN